MLPPMTAPAQVNDDDADLFLCPACGYDLRGTAGDRCGECGLEIDRAGLRVSGIPWVYRGRMLRARIYKTARAFARDCGVRFEAARPQEIRDGCAFAASRPASWRSRWSGRSSRASTPRAGWLRCVSAADQLSQIQAPVSRACSTGPCRGVRCDDPGRVAGLPGRVRVLVTSAQCFAFRTRQGSAVRRAGGGGAVVLHDRPPAAAASGDGVRAGVGLADPTSGRLLPAEFHNAFLDTPARRWPFRWRAA